MPLMIGVSPVVGWKVTNLSKKFVQSVCYLSIFAVLGAADKAYGQSFAPSKKPKLAADSPFQDPDMIYLEADELINNEDARTLTARGEVEGRYQDRTIRAEEVVYYLDQGRVIASGNVVLVSSDGTSQYAETLELSNELEAGNATNFTSRLPNGGVSGATFATRRNDDGIDLYNAYYTACSTCEDENKKTPTWQLKARRVSQDKDRNMVLYKDAVFELFGLPVLYTPYLAHPDPSQDRASGWLNPFGGYSSSKGAFIEMPYYIDMDDYSELTLTPHIYSGVNPLLKMDYRRKFYSGELNIDSSFTYASAFDKRGDAFTETDTFLRLSEHAPLGKRLRSHFFADGEFNLAKKWDWGFTAQATTDDLYLRRYDLFRPRRAGIYDGGMNRLISQIFAVGQDENFRFSASAYGFQSLRTNIRDSDADAREFIISREDDSALPIIAPKIELSHHFKDPLFKGRFEAFGDFTMLSRDIGNDYRRGTIGAEWSKSFILPAGIEAKPFGQVRYDNFEVTPYDRINETDFDDVSFSRSLGYAGMEIRWPFIKSTGNVDFIIEPRAMITKAFGNGKISELRRDTDGDGDIDIDLLQDSLEIDFDHNLIWSPNKSTGFDLWQKGLRADVGGSVSALWNDNHATLFVGQSFTDDADDIFELESGLVGSETVLDAVTGIPTERVVDKSDIVGQFELALSKNFLFDTRVRFDDDENKFRRLDTGFRYSNKIFGTNLRYYKIDRAIADSLTDLTALAPAPAEEISGSASLKLTKNWGLKYRASHDLDQDITRTQSFGLTYSDNCTTLELSYRKNNFGDDVVRDTDSIGFRISLKTLGDFGGTDDRDEF